MERCEAPPTGFLVRYLCQFQCEAPNSLGKFQRLSRTFGGPPGGRFLSQAGEGGGVKTSLAGSRTASMALPDTVGPGQDAVHVQVLRLLVLAAQGSPPGAWGGGGAALQPQPVRNASKPPPNGRGSFLRGGGLPRAPLAVALHFLSRVLSMPPRLPIGYPHSCWGGGLGGSGNQNSFSRHFSPEKFFFCRLEKRQDQHLHSVLGGPSDTTPPNEIKKIA